MSNFGKPTKYQDKIIELYNSGKSIPYIEKKLKIKRGCIYPLFKRNKIKLRDDFAKQIRTLSVDETFFEKIDTEAKAYILGLLYADGHNCISGNFFTISLHPTDYDILNKVREALKSDAKIRTHFPYDKKYDKIRTNMSLQICSRKMCRDLQKLGCEQNKTAKIRFPFWLQKKYWSHFVRGYFDGDGCICKAKPVKNNRHILFRFNITSNLNFIADLGKVFYKIFNKKYTISKIHNNTKQISTSGNKSVEKVLKWLYKDATIYMDRKYNIYQELLNRKYFHIKPFKLYLKKDDRLVGEFRTNKQAADFLGYCKDGFCKIKNNKSHKFHNIYKIVNVQ